MTGVELVELKQKAANLVIQMREHLDKFADKQETAENTEAFKKMDAECDRLDDLILKEEKMQARERAVGEKADNGKPQMNDAVKKAFINHIREGSAVTLNAYQNLTQSNPTQAGYLVAPEQFVREVIKDLADATFMRQKARVLPPLQAAQSMGIPTRTAGMSSFAWGTENSAPTADTALAYGKREFKPNPGNAEILISRTLMRNVPDADAILREEIAEDVGAGLETAYMSGSGANCPLGVFTASADGIPTSRDVSTGNTATEIKFDGLIEAEYHIKSQYRAGAEWIFHRTGVKQIRKLKNSDGQYIWQSSVAVGAPNTLLSYPVNESEYAPSTFTTGLYVGLLGQLKKYWICDSLSMEIQVLVELYARTNYIDYIVRLETDGAPVLANAFARVKLA
jgi:HK97 family phage major capsid protein